MSETEDLEFPTNEGARRMERLRKRFSFSLEDISDATVPVFVRLKPRKDTSRVAETLNIDTSSNSITIKKKTVEKTYRFTHIFEAETSQEEIFEKCAKPYLQGFLKGTQKNIFIFTYGASCSGKTYTIQGEPESPGIIPRLLAALFKSVEGHLEYEPKSRPNQNGVILQSLQAEQRQEKNLILKLSKTLLNMSFSKNRVISFSDLEELKVSSGKMKLADPDGSYSIWLSYYEIYNEQVFDLLDEPRESRPHLRILNDKCAAFVEGLKCIQVSSLYEAYLLYTYGRYNLTVSATGVNSKSSRSHAMFSVRLLSGDHSLNSSFLVCDLAGTERADRTGNVGLRLREAQRINTSFLTLNRCLRAIRENQSSGRMKRVPYRESKLTKVLGPALGSGDSSLAMIVTVAGDEGLLEETESVLSASNVAALIRAPPLAGSRGTFASLLATTSLDWNEVAKKKLTMTPGEIRRNIDYYFSDDSSNTSSLINSDLSVPDVYKQLQEEKLKRKQLEEKLADLEKMYKEKSNEGCKCETADKTIDFLQKELQEQEEDSMISRTEVLKLKKTLRIMKDENDNLHDHIIHLQSINKGLNEMLDDAREDIVTFQKEGQELEIQLQEKQQLINLKDDKLHTFEQEIVELEQNLEKNAVEIEAYDKQISTLESELSKMKNEVKKLTDKNEILKENCKFSTEKCKILEEKLNHKRESLPENTDNVYNMIQRKSQQKMQLIKYNSESEDITFHSIQKPRSLRNRSKSMTGARNIQWSCSNISHSDNKENKYSTLKMKIKKKLFHDSAMDVEEVFVNQECREFTPSSPRTVLKRILRSGKQY